MTPRPAAAARDAHPIGWTLGFGRRSGEERPVETRAQVESRRDRLAQIYEEFEEFMEAILDAAQYGPTYGLVERYRERRARWLAVFPAVRPYAVAYLREDPSDAEFGRRHEGRATDTFEALALAEDLPTWLDWDDGAMTDRIVRAREALSLYAEHLRLLSGVRR